MGDGKTFQMLRLFYPSLLSSRDIPGRQILCNRDVPATQLLYSRDIPATQYLSTRDLPATQLLSSRDVPGRRFLYSRDNKLLSMLCVPWVYSQNILSHKIPVNEQVFLDKFLYYSCLKNNFTLWFLQLQDVFSKEDNIFSVFRIHNCKLSQAQARLDWDSFIITIPVVCGYPSVTRNSFKTDF